ncbi:MAG: peptidyl-prolyl cis-trans isomerase [Planctomycetota bacterium]|jgi:hypothetical protein
MVKVLNNLVREPLFHFLAIGAMLYALSVKYGTATEAEPDNTITITTGEIDWLTQSFSQRWHRPPTPEEFEGILTAHIREKVLYLEALAMGLDQDDVIIRRRLAQKLEFLFQDLSDLKRPSEEELLAYFQDNLDNYQEPEVTTFTHVYVDPDARGDQTLDDAEQILTALKALDDPTQGHEELGDRFMLQSYYPRRPSLEIAKLFGKGFAQAIDELSPGQWHGPVLSGYGVHLVYVHDRSQEPPPTYEEVQSTILEDWQAEQRQKFNEQFVAGLMARHNIVIEDMTGEGEGAGEGEGKQQ